MIVEFGRRNAEVGKRVKYREPDGRGQMSEDRRQRTEVGSGNAEVGKRDAEGGMWKSEKEKRLRADDPSSLSELRRGTQNSEDRRQMTEGRNRKWDPSSSDKAGLCRG